MRVETMTREISEGVQKDGVYVIRDEDLRRLWPDLRYRYLQVKDFAAAHGWRVFAYGDRRGAMFIRKGKAPAALRSKLDLEWWYGSVHPVSTASGNSDFRRFKARPGK